MNVVNAMGQESYLEHVIVKDKNLDVMEFVVLEQLKIYVVYATVEVSLKEIVTVMVTNQTVMVHAVVSENQMNAESAVDMVFLQDNVTVKVM